MLSLHMKWWEGSNPARIRKEMRSNMGQKRYDCCLLLYSECKIYEQHFVVLKFSLFRLVVSTVHYVHCVTSEEDKSPEAKEWAGDHITQSSDLQSKTNPRWKHSTGSLLRRRIYNMSTLRLPAIRSTGVSGLIQIIPKAIGQEKTGRYWSGFLAGLIQNREYRFNTSNPF